MKNTKNLLIFIITFFLLSACNSFRTFIGDYSVVSLDQPVWQEGFSEWTPSFPAQNKNLPRLNRNVIGEKLSVDNVEFDKGISVGGNAIFIYSPKKKAAFIQFHAGIDDASPLKNGQSKLEVICNGKVVQEATLFQGGGSKYFDVSLIEVGQVIIHIKAETNVYTDLVMPRIVGIPGLRDALRTGKTYYDNYIFNKIPELKNEKILQNGDVIFPEKNSCIGLSNKFISLIISPKNGGKVISFKNSLFDFSDVSLHPKERRKFSSNIAKNGNWKWKIDDEGILRLLSPPDLVNGVRWSKTFQLISNVVHVVLMAKNCVDHEISWSFGTKFGIPKNSEVYFAAENQKPGFSLLSGLPLSVNIEKKIVKVSCSRSKKFSLTGKKERVVATSEQSWLAIKNNKSVFFAIAIEVEKGSFPYVNSRIMVDENKTILFSELTPLMPGNHYVQEQFWTVEPWENSIEKVVRNAKNNIIKIKEISEYPHGKPTGRKRQNL